MSEPDYKALYEEAERLRKEEERRRKEEERRRKEEERCRKEEERRRKEEERRRKEEQRNQGLQEMQQKQSEQADQHIHPYLALVSRLHTYASRLLVPVPTQTSEPTVAMKQTATTGGRTSIDNKFYPLKLHVWSEFPELHKRTFSRILELDRGGLPAHKDVQKDEGTIARRLPVTDEEIEFFLDETRTAQYVDVAWETPAWYVLRQFLTTLNAGHRVHFLSNLGARDKNLAATSSTVSSARSATNSSSDSSTSSQSKSGAPPATALKANPDCVVLALAAGAPNRRIAVGEYKPCHALPSAQAAAISHATLPEAYMVRLAREARSRRAQRLRTKLARQAQQERADSADPEIVLPDAEQLTTQWDAPTALPRQVYFSYAITQTYHYMLVSGTSFGYVATGETITVLHIPDDDPTCLLYYTSVFPAPPVSDAAAEPSLVTAVPPLSASDPANLDALLELPVAQLCSLSVLAYETDNAHRDTQWTANVLGLLALFPRAVKPNASGQRAESPSTLGRRRRDDDDNDDDDNDNNDVGRSTRRRTLQPPASGIGSGSQVRTPSPLQHVSSAEGHSARQADARAPNTGSRIRKPTLSYCTQACLRGLSQGRPLDPKCPNVASHRRGPNLRGPGASPDTHRITADQLQELVCAQLLRSPEYDIECLYSAGMGGAIGHLFKITATEYGYTLVAKAVQWQHRRRLQHEERVYGHLRKHQGVLVPVCMGGFELAVPYPLLNYFRAVTHMLLLSYGGIPVQHVQAQQKTQVQGLQTKLQQQSPPPSEAGDAPVGSAMPLPWDNVDIEAEAKRTIRELEAAGFFDEDDNTANALWCAETGRVMKIDFDRAHVVPLGAAQDAPAEARKRAHDEAVKHCPEPSDGKRAKHEILDEENM